VMVTVEMSDRGVVVANLGAWVMGTLSSSYMRRRRRLAAGGSSVSLSGAEGTRSRGVVSLSTKSL